MKIFVVYLPSRDEPFKIKGESVVYENNKIVIYNKDHEPNAMFPPGCCIIVQDS